MTARAAEEVVKTPSEITYDNFAKKREIGADRNTESFPNKRGITLRKPIFLAFSNYEISKLSLYKINYYKLPLYFEEYNLKIQSLDTDSLLEKFYDR